MSFANISIKYKLLSLAGVVGFFLLLVTLLLELQLSALGDQDEAMFIENKMLQARRSEKDFLARRDTAYVDKVINNCEAMHEHVEVFSGTETGDALTAAITEYENAFKSVVNKTVVRGLDEKSGAEGALRESVHKIEEILNSLQRDDLKVEMLMARRGEKDFFLRKKEKYIGKVETAITNLVSKVDRSYFSATIKSEINQYAENYLAKFKLAAKSIQDQAAQIAVMRDAVHQIEPLVETLVEETHSEADFYGTVGTAAVVISILFSIVFSLVLSAKITAPVVKLQKAADEFSKGNLDSEVDISSEDEVGKLAVSFNQAVKQVKASQLSLQEEKESVERKVEEAVRESELQKAYLTDSVDKILVEMNSFSSGDLTVNLHVDNDDEIGKLFQGFNKAVSMIKQMITRVTEAVEATASASSEISASAEEMASGSQEQSSQTSEVAVSIEEMTKTILSTSENASNASKSAKRASEKAETGFEKVQENKKGIERIIGSAQTTGEIIASLAGRTDQIGQITQVIDDIADQTNLLALNAAIEAARAGEQGRGFAVVADEVRKLAERTTKATKEIAETIKAIQIEAKDADSSMLEARDSVMEGQKITGEVEKALTDILESIGEVSMEINQVATASEEQSSASEEISRSITAITAVTHQSASATQQIARTAEDLNQLTENLQQLATRFILARDEAGAVQHDEANLLPGSEKEFLLN